MMTLIFENKIMNLKQLNTDIFNNTARSIVYRRLRKLVANGYLEKRPFYSNNRAFSSFSITKKALNEIQSVYPFQITNQKLKSDSVYHDLMLVNIRGVLEKIASIKCYYTENVLHNCEEFKEDYDLQPFIDLRSDAALGVQLQSRFVHMALEYECSLKSRKRYIDKFSNYFANENIGEILYICANEKIRHFLQSVEKEIIDHFGDPFKIHYCLLESVIHSGDNVRFESVDGHLLEFKKR